MGVSITKGIHIQEGKYEKLIPDMMAKFKAENYIQAEIFKQCAFETSTGIFDHVGTGNAKRPIDWAGLVLHHPSKEIWKVGPLAVILKTWWDDFAGKMTLEEFLKCPPITIEILQSINDFNKKQEAADATALKKKVEDIENLLHGKKK